MSNHVELVVRTEAGAEVYWTGAASLDEARALVGAFFRGERQSGALRGLRLITPPPGVYLVRYTRRGRTLAGERRTV